MANKNHREIYYIKESIGEFNKIISKIERRNQSNANVTNPQVHICKESKNVNIQPKSDYYDLLENEKKIHVEHKLNKFGYNENTEKWENLNPNTVPVGFKFEYNEQKGCWCYLKIKNTLD